MHACTLPYAHILCARTYLHNMYARALLAFLLALHTPRRGRAFGIVCGRHDMRDRTGYFCGTVGVGGKGGLEGWASGAFYERSVTPSCILVSQRPWAVWLGNSSCGATFVPSRCLPPNHLYVFYDPMFLFFSSPLPTVNSVPLQQPVCLSPLILVRVHKPAPPYHMASCRIPY